MKNHIQKGDVITAPAPAGGIASDEGAIIGNIFGIAAYAAAVGDPLELATTGVFQLPKATAAVLTVGARASWDNTTKNINVPGTGRFPVGIATEANGITASRCGWMASGPLQHDRAGYPRRAEWPHPAGR